MLSQIILLSLCCNYSSNIFIEENDPLFKAYQTYSTIANDLNVDITNNIFVYDLLDDTLSEQNISLCSFDNGKYFTYNNEGTILYFNLENHIFDTSYDDYLIQKNGKIYDKYDREFFSSVDSSNTLNYEDCYNNYLYEDLHYTDDYGFSNNSTNYELNNQNIIYCQDSFFFQNINYDYILAGLSNTNFYEYTKNAAAALSGILTYYLISNGNEVMYPLYENRADLLGELIPSKKVGTNYRTWTSPYINYLADHLLGYEGFKANCPDFFYSFSKMVDSTAIILKIQQDLGLGFESNSISNTSTNISLFYSYEDGLGIQVENNEINQYYYFSRPGITGITMNFYFDAFLVNYVNDKLINRHRPLLVNSMHKYGIAYGVYTNDEGYMYLLTNVVGGDKNEGILVNIDTDLTVDQYHSDSYHLELLSFLPNYTLIDDDDFIPSYMSLNSNNNYNIYGECVQSTFSTINKNNHYRHIGNLTYEENHYFINYLTYKKCACCGHKIYNSGIEDVPGV